MKFAIFAASLFLLVIAPVDAAEPNPPCAEIDIVKTLAARVSLRRDCSLEATILEDVTCVGGWGGSVERNVDKHTIKAYYCTGGPFPPIAFPAEFAGPTCKPVDENIGVGTVSIAATCHVQADIKFYDCVWNCGWETIVDTDQVTVRHYTQQSSTQTATTGPTCKPMFQNTVIGTIETSRDCHTQIDIKFYDCIYDCGWETIVSTDVLTVRHYTQQNGGGTQLAATQPCDDGSAGFWGAQIDTREDCTADIGIIDAYRLCPTGTTAESRGATFGGNMVYAGYCVPGLQVATAGPSCNGIWYYSETFEVGRTSVTIGTDGSLECTTITIS